MTKLCVAQSAPAGELELEAVRLISLSAGSLLTAAIGLNPGALFFFFAEFYEGLVYVKLSTEHAGNTFTA